MGKVTFEEFIGRLQAVQKNFPDDVEVVLNRSANRMIRALKENSPDSGKDHKGKLNKSWKKQIERRWVDGSETHTTGISHTEWECGH